MVGPKNCAHVSVYNKSSSVSSVLQTGESLGLLSFVSKVLFEEIFDEAK